MSMDNWECPSMHGMHIIQSTVGNGGSPHTTCLQNKHPLCCPLLLLPLLLVKQAKDVYTTNWTGVNMSILEHAQCARLICIQSAQSQSLGCMCLSTDMGGWWHFRHTDQSRTLLPHRFRNMNYPQQPLFQFLVHQILEPSCRHLQKLLFAVQLVLTRLCNPRNWVDIL